MYFKHIKTITETQRDRLRGQLETPVSWPLLQGSEQATLICLAPSWVPFKQWVCPLLALC